MQGPATAAGVAPQMVAPQTTAPDPAAVTAYEEVLAKWEKDKALALDLITQRIPDSTVIHTVNLSTAAAMWTEIVREYTEKGTMAQTDLRTEFLESKCPIGGDVRTWLDSLRVKREELAQAGVDIDKKDYCSTIIKSLPPFLSNFSSSLLANAHLYAPNKSIDPDILISLIIEEYKHGRSDRAQQNHNPNGRGKDNDEAMAITSSSYRNRGNSNSNSNSHSSSRNSNTNVKGPTCWNCRETGHLRRKCPKPKKATGSSGRTESANHVVEDSDDEAFGVSDSDSVADSVPNLESITDSSDDSHSASSMPGLMSVSDLSDEGDVGSDYNGDDWFSDVGDDLNTPWGDGCDTDELSGINSEGSSFVDVDLELVGEMSNDEIRDSPDIIEPDDVANAAMDGASNANEIRTKLYDSGTTRHISLYRNLFDNYVEIPPSR